METFKIAAIGIVSALLAITLKKNHPELSASIGIACGVIIFSSIAGSFFSIIDEFRFIIEKSGLSPVYFKTILKISGIAYITKFASEICRDSGENAIASKIEFGGKISILALTIPIIGDFLNLITETLSSF